MELKKMSGGMMADTDELTAVPEMVLENETFIGRGEDEAQSGTMPDMSKVKNSPTKAKQCQHIGQQMQRAPQTQTEMCKL